MPAQINHLFVLMMENRSMDHMLGFTKAPGYDIEGLDAANPPYNENLQEQRVYASSNARYTGDLGSDPNHHFLDVMEQIYGSPNPQPGQPITMSGFVRNYQRKTGSAAEGANVMRCFNPHTLPVLSTLAREYAVCDHWYSSIPGPTLPNRLYAHCGTSRGRLDMSVDFYRGFYTVYEELFHQRVSSTIFWSDWSGTLTFDGLLRHQNLFYTPFRNFEAMCKGPANRMPAYCFIEPRYHPADDPYGGVFPATDQHPDNDVRDGEKLLLDVYNAIRQNDELWHSSALIIVYDEHGGLYDHVPPVPLPSPDGLVSLDPAFDFKLSGLRVPALVVSPYVPRGTISKLTYDHTSIIATALQLFTKTWPTDALFHRAQQANTITGLLDLNMAPRDDRPTFAPAPTDNVIPSLQAMHAPLSDLQIESVKHAAELNASLPAAFRVNLDPLSIKDAGSAGAFTTAVGEAALSAHEGIKA